MVSSAPTFSAVPERPANLTSHEAYKHTYQHTTNPLNNVNTTTTPPPSPRRATPRHHVPRLHPLQVQPCQHIPLLPRSYPRPFPHRPTNRRSQRLGPQQMSAHLRPLHPPPHLRPLRRRNAEGQALPRAHGGFCAVLSGVRGRKGFIRPW